jgi:hypothetical protein
MASATTLRKSLRKWAKNYGVTVTEEHDALTRGRAWYGDGPRGVVEHHWAGVGDGAAAWMAARNESTYPYCNSLIRRDGTIHVLSYLSVWHSGTGGPWTAAGVPKDQGSYYLWGTEFESWGRVKDFTPEMWRAQAVLDCALREAAGEEAFPNFRRLINHKDWTNGSAGVASYRLSTYGRKNDTLYDASDFRRNANKLWKTEMKSRETAPVTPEPAPEVEEKPLVRVSNVQPGKTHPHVLRVQAALRKELGVDLSAEKLVFGPATQATYLQWQAKCGINGDFLTGIPGIGTLTKLGDKYGFRVEE